MEQTLHQAAIEGNVTLLHQILKKDPLVLYRLNSDLAEVPDSSQRLPLHLASAKGHVNVVEALISVDPEGQGRCVESVSSSQFPSS
ncbi:hypothetical protein LOK49_LG11G01709 [Camellia lanceoleosa]|uniref:Uncharacterized protein n=1 Tax=Camellia lanceoleosa TaxID=1840588 RepID=A0ACC0G0R7_9ERIC|nr:hypothetical protein LOK49_LG11G01709 [Camellia lanceoleosa]